MSSRAAKKAKQRKLFPYGRPKECPKPQDRPAVVMLERMHAAYAAARRAREEINRQGVYWNYPYGGATACSIFGGRVMNIPVIHEDETENEFDIEMCCEACASKNYGWTGTQYTEVYQKAEKGEPIQIPDDVTDETKFRAFVKTL